MVRDVKERGRDIEGCIKQWFGFVKPNFYKYVSPQREIADIIIETDERPPRLVVLQILDRLKALAPH